MAYIQGYKYDIFISYAHLDNEKVFGQAIGWIEHFYTDLNALLSRRVGKTDAVKIWWDNKKLDGSILFDHSIDEGIEQSAIMICLTSPAYLLSEYCQKELHLFYNKAKQEPAGLEVSDRSRIINVLLNNIPYTEWPKELSGTTGFPFHDADNIDDFGDLLDVRDQKFINQLQNFRDAVMKLILEFKKNESVKTASPVVAPVNIPIVEETVPEDRFSIFIGDVADGLRTVRKRTITELEKKGFIVVHDVPPPFELEQHDIAVKEKLEKADLAVHLLDVYPGREIEEQENIWYPQKQAELGLQFSKSQLIWIPQDVNVEVIEEETYKEFVQGLENIKQAFVKTEYIRGIRGELTQQIIDHTDKLKAQKIQPPAEKLSVLLDTHYNDQLYALKLSENLIENGIQPYINPQEDDPKKNINMLADRISQVSKLVFFFGKVSKDWVQGRMNEALKLIIENDYPIEDFFVFMVPPHKEPDAISLRQRFLTINVVNHSDTPPFNAATLQEFLKKLRP